MTKYISALNVLQAYPIADFTISKPFPVVNTPTTLTNANKYENSFEWSTQTSVAGSITTNSIDRSVVIVPIAQEPLLQIITNTNTNTTVSKSKYIYPLPVPSEAFIEFSLPTGVIRIGETVPITLINKYNFIGALNIDVVITDHETGAVVQTYINVDVDLGVNFTATTRQSLDIEVQATSNGKTMYFKQGMILTVVPALGVRGTGAVIEHVIVDTERGKELNPTLGHLYNSIGINVLDGSQYAPIGTAYADRAAIPPGTTIILSLDPLSDPDGIYRIKIEHLKGTAENPIIITHDSNAEFIIAFESYYGINILDCQHIILDGKGYNNVERGFVLTESIKKTTGGLSGINAGNMTSFFEIHNVVVRDIEFSGFSIKTDPYPDAPQYWRPAIDDDPSGFTMRDLRVHNCYFNHTEGEGIYLGYFNASIKSGINSAGETVYYRAHKLIDTKVYRNEFYKCGWDSLQANNNYGNTEIAYNLLIDSANLGEVDQDSGMSLSMEGSIHDNIIRGGTGNSIQVAPLGPLKIYNNVISGLRSGVNVIFLLGGDGHIPESNVGYDPTIGDNGSDSNDIPVEIFNNNLFGTGPSNLISAQAVVQYKGIVLTNNLVNFLPGKDFSNQAQETQDLWDEASANNLNINYYTDVEMKMANAEAGDFRLFMDSLLAIGATAKTFPGDPKDYSYDIRGYKNWASNDMFVGAYAGEIPVPDGILSLLSFTIVNTDTLVFTRALNLTYTKLGYPTHYMISEYPNFIDGVWIDSIANPSPEFICSYGEGLKTLYFKIKNNFQESGTLSHSVYYSTSKHHLISLQSDNLTYNISETLTGQWWTNFNFPTGTNPSVKSSIIDHLGDISTINLEVTVPFDGIGGNTDLDTTYAYIQPAVRFNWEIFSGVGSPGGQIDVTGLDNTKLYVVKLYSARGSVPTDSVYDVNGQEIIFNNNAPVNIGSLEAAVFNNVILDINNKIIIKVKTVAADNQTASLGVIEILEKIDIPVLNSLTIDSNSTSSSIPITLNVETVPVPDEYMISENFDFIGASWIPYTNPNVTYTFDSNTLELKTIYAKTRLGIVESAVKYSATTLTVLGIGLSTLTMDSIVDTGAVDITVAFVNGPPTLYRIGEDPDFITSTGWLAYSSSILTYTFSALGQHDLYVQLEDGSAVQSNVLTQAVNNINPILSVDSFLINGGAGTTEDENVSIVFTHTGDADQYMISEDAAFTGGTWVNIVSNTIAYALPAGLGVNTLYFKIKDPLKESVAVNSSIEIVAPAAVSVQIDLGQDTGGKVAPAPWNNYTGTNLDSGVVISNMINTNSVATGFDLEVISPFDLAEGNFDGAAIVANLPYHIDACEDVLRTIAGSPAQLSINNLDDLKTYTFIFYAYRGFVGNESKITIGGTSVVIAHKADLYVTKTIANVSPTAGKIVIQVEGNTVGTYGFLGVIDMFEN